MTAAVWRWIQIQGWSSQILHILPLQQRRSLLSCKLLQAPDSHYLMLAWRRTGQICAGPPPCSQMIRVAQHSAAIQASTSPAIEGTMEGRRALVLLLLTLLLLVPRASLAQPYPCAPGCTERG